MSEDQWAQAFEDSARHYWEHRQDELLQGKQLLLTPLSAPRVLRALGLLHRDASMPPKQVRKFFQINHMLRCLRPPLEEMASKGKPLSIVDAGCGKSYVTLALAWCFEHVFHVPAGILGVDRNAELIEEARRLTELAGLDHVLKHAAGDLGRLDLGEAWVQQFQTPFELDGVIALHACDTATDDAIALGVRNQAQLIAVAPCCHAELAHKWSNLGEVGAFAPVWNTPQLRRSTGADLTDTFRSLLLQATGYETRVVEFVASTHTPKNTLIRGMKRADSDPAALAAYHALKASTGGVGIKLEGLLGV